MINLHEFIHIIAFTITLILSLVAGPFFIPKLTKFKFGQTVREDGPQTHLVKTGTPTMGGIIFLLPIFIVSLVLAIYYPKIRPLVFVTLGFGLIGFIDDYVKIVNKSHDGLNPIQKMIGLFIISIGFVFYILNFTSMKSSFEVIFLGIDITFGYWWVYFIYVILVLLATTNSVNMTDGLDGLATGISMIVFVFFAVLAIFTGLYDDIKIFSAIVAGGCLGFLAFNLFPAKVFMGDTGSLALGGAVGALVIMGKTPPIIIFIICGVFVVETLSVFIQVVSYKLRKKRVFKMAPIHHHFELCGWKETKVVKVFWSISVLLCILGALALYFKIY